MSTLSKIEQQQLFAQKFYKNLKNKNNASTSGGTLQKDIEKSTQTSDINNVKSDDTLTRRAIEEIVRDTKRAAEIAEYNGPTGWRAQPAKKPNKRFLANTMRSVITHNKRTTVKNAIESKRKLDEVSKRKPKFGTRLHSFQEPNERMTKKDKRKNDD